MTNKKVTVKMSQVRPQSRPLGGPKQAPGLTMKDLGVQPGGGSGPKPGYYIDDDGEVWWYSGKGNNVRQWNSGHEMWDATEDDPDIVAQLPSFQYSPTMFPDPDNADNVAPDPAEPNRYGTP